MSKKKREASKVIHVLKPQLLQPEEVYRTKPFFHKVLNKIAKTQRINRILPAENHPNSPERTSKVGWIIRC
jgi:hypothetical protein